MSSWFRLAFLSLLAPVATAQDNVAISTRKISSTQGGFAGALANGDRFGASVCSLGDLDGDGVVDLAVGAPGDDGGGSDRGAVWILFLKRTGAPVKSALKIDETIGGFTSALADGAAFGTSVALIGDFSGDGLRELAVGAPATAAAGVPGSVYLLSLNASGAVVALKTLAPGVNGIPASLVEESDPFGEAVTGIGDLDSDGIPDLAIGRKLKNGYGYILVARMRADGTARNVLRIGKNEGGFEGEYPGGTFGASLAPIGDLNRDGVLDLLVGDAGEGHPWPGAYWVLFLEPFGEVASEVNVTGYQPFMGAGRIGAGIARVGDVDGDGTEDLLLGAPNRGWYDGNPNVPTNYRPETGAVVVTLLSPDGTPHGSTEISRVSGGLGTPLDTYDHFGGATSALGDFDLDGIFDAVAGTPDDDDGGTNRGAICLLSLLGYEYPSSATVYNGSHLNALCHVNVSPPALGTTWTATVDASAHPGATFTGFHLSLARRPPGAFVFGGTSELLVHLGSQLLGTSVQATSGGVDTFLSPIPAVSALFGIRVHTQGFIVGGGKELCNALELFVRN
jgi:hypothetical protein